MSYHHLQPLRDPRDPVVLMPEEDTRWVGSATMAAYLGCSTWSIWKRTQDGEFPKLGVDKRGSNLTLYQPATIYRLLGLGRFATAYA